MEAVLTDIGGRSSALSSFWSSLGWVIELLVASVPGMVVCSGGTVTCKGGDEGVGGGAVRGCLSHNGRWCTIDE